MDFHLEYNPKPFVQKIAYQHKLMLVGSCFTENIGDKLSAHKFSVLQNPNGILFNPVSVVDSIQQYISNKPVDAGELFNLNEAWHSWKFHSRFSSPSVEEACNKMNASMQAAHQYLQSANVLMLTFGSAWVYKLTSFSDNASKQEVAANNHKAPANWFNRVLLHTDEVVAMLNAMIGMLQAFNPGLRIILTISPVRHLREGFVENNRSKATLINAIHEIAGAHAHVDYFPAYELVIDDLRDYRFYAEDMVHPNYAATDYVWDKFVQCSIDAPSQALMIRINELNAARKHKPFNPGSEAHKRFLRVNYEKAKIIATQYPNLDMEEALGYFST